MGAEAILADQHHSNIYEKALATYGCAEFVEECLKRGCSPHHVSLKKCYYHSFKLNHLSVHRSINILTKRPLAMPVIPAILTFLCRY